MGWCWFGSAIEDSVDFTFWLVLQFVKFFCVFHFFLQGVQCLIGYFFGGWFQSSGELVDGLFLIYNPHSVVQVLFFTC